jgi:GH15 family glucan-1,4-alpha-glucosidase
MLHKYVQDLHLPTKKYLPIEDYGMIGDLHTIALVGKNGSIDWSCFPRFDSPSAFGALLDAEKGGFFRIAPLEPSETMSNQSYMTDTNILITHFSTSTADADLIDFMPVAQNNGSHHQSAIYRAIQVKRGTMTFGMVCRPAFNYAKGSHTVNQSGDSVIFTSDALSLALTSSVQMKDDERNGTQAIFTLQAGETAYFFLNALEPATSSLPCPTIEHHSRHFQGAFLITNWYWQNWLSQNQYEGRWDEMVRRSALALKLLTYAPTGAIVAAPTASLPEMIGGERNWDYRYTWLRDASFTLNSLLLLGFTAEAEAFFHWLDERIDEINAGTPLQPMYTIDGGHDLTEFTLDHLEGYDQSGPVRIGNGAYKQLQLDVYGELMDTIFTYSKQKTITPEIWKIVLHLTDWLSEHWQEEDEGIWEVRGGTKQFVHSRVMSWVAFDRAINIANQHGLTAPLATWTTIRSEIYTEIMTYGWNEEVQSFVQYYGSQAVDASVLQMILTKFTDPTDPRLISTIDRIQSELSINDRVYRYHPQLAADDGFNSAEGTFIMCSFWLVEALTAAGRLLEAQRMLENLLTYANHVGLFAEENGAAGQALGNFPQAFSHLSLISACYHLNEALNSQNAEITTIATTDVAPVTSTIEAEEEEVAC